MRAFLFTKTSFPIPGRVKELVLSVLETANSPPPIWTASPSFPDPISGQGVRMF